MLRKSLSASKTLCLFTAFILLLSAFCGCSKKHESSEGSETVIFTDALGREVTVNKKVERTAALLGSFADTWVLAGGTLCAAPKDAWDDFGLNLENTVNLGGAHSPSLEALLSADPDFVIASSATAAAVEMKEALENAGITVAYFDVNSFYDYLAMLKICTDITGRKDLYEQNGERVKDRIEKMKSDFHAAALPEEKRTVLLLRNSASSIKAKGSEGTVLGEMLYDLGCVNIADSDQTLLDHLSVENVIKDEPYRIFAVTMGDDTAAAEKNLTKLTEENPAWGKLEAVTQHRMHIMDRKLFNLKPNANWAKAYEQLVEILLK